MGCLVALCVLHRYEELTYTPKIVDISVPKTFISKEDVLDVLFDNDKMKALKQQITKKPKEG